MLFTLEANFISGVAAKGSQCSKDRESIVYST